MKSNLEQSISKEQQKFEAEITANDGKCLWKKLYDYKIRINASVKNKDCVRCDGYNNDCGYYHEGKHKDLQVR